MAERRPLCLVNGIVSGLPAGDTLPGAGWSVIAARNTTQVTLTNSTAPNVVTLATIPANTLQVGDRVMLKAGFRITNGTTGVNFNTAFRANATAPATTLTALGTTATTNRYFEVNYFGVITAIGAAAQIALRSTVYNLTTVVNAAIGNSGSLALGDTTAAGGLVLGVQYNFSTASATVTAVHLFSDLEIIR